MVDIKQQRIYWESYERRQHPSTPSCRDFVKPKLDFIFKKIGQVDSILDVGCGNGYFTYYLEQIAPTMGLDYAMAMLKQNPATDLLQGSADQLPFANKGFDLVLCSNLLHHLPRPIQVIQEMKRMSKRYVVLSEPNRNNPAILALGLVKKEERDSLKFTGAYLCRIAEEAGLKIIDYQTMGFVTPNRMPKLAVKFLSNFNQPHPLAAYSVLIAKSDES